MFEKLPDNFFSLLTSVNRDLYLEALFLLRDMYKHSSFIRKDEYITILISNLQESIIKMEIEDEDIYTDTSFSSLAHLLLRRLKFYGWIDIEHKEHTFDEYVILRNFSSKLLNILRELINEDTDKYNTYVYNTYTLLKAADQERDEYIYTALINAYKATFDLKDTLINLLNNIRYYHQQILKRAEVDGLLDDHFNIFKQNISDKIYHPLKTFDSLPKFKTPILKILKSWLLDSDIIDLLVDCQIKKEGSKEREEVIDHLICMINEIIDVYETIEELISEIDNRHTGYTRASVQKIQYILNTDRSVKGKIIEILKKCKSEESEKSNKLIDEMRISVNVFKQQFVDEYSLYEKPKRRGQVTFEPITFIEQISEEEINNELKIFKEKLINRYTDKKIIQYINSQFNISDSFTSNEIKLEVNEEFIMLILAVLKHDEKNVSYKVEFDDGNIKINGYRIPNMKFTRKDHKDVD